MHHHELFDLMMVCRVMNGPIEAIARELGFDGDTFLEGLVVSIFIVGAFIGSVTCGSLINRLGCRRTLQIDMVPLIVGALLRFPVTMFLFACFIVCKFPFNNMMYPICIWRRLDFHFLQTFVILSAFIYVLFFSCSYHMQ